MNTIKKLEFPNNPEECKKVCGLINYLFMYVKNLQKRLIPICCLERKEIPFKWMDEHWKSFEDIKHDLSKTSVLFLPNNKGLFTLVLDASCVACGTTYSAIKTQTENIYI